MPSRRDGLPTGRLVPGQKIGHATVIESTTAKARPSSGPPAAHWSTFVRGDATKLKRRGMNKTEASYGRHLDDRKVAGEILWWAFQPMRLRLTDSPEAAGRKAVWITVDFGVLLPDGLYELHETKGYTAPQDLLRLKMAADRHPFRFRLVKRVKGGWSVENL